MPQTIKAEELMTQRYKWIGEHDSLGKALSCFDESCDALLVNDEKKNYSGILTERMIMRSGLDRGKTKVKKLKRFAPKISKSTLIPEVAGLMVQNDMLHLPVFDKNKVVGIIDDMRLLTAVAAKDFGKLSIKNFMTSDVHTISPQEKISVVLHNFRVYHIGRLPVVNHNKLVGMITLHDVVSKMIQPKEHTNLDWVLREKISAWDLPVEDIMSNTVITSSVTSIVNDIINKMNKFHISGIPIINEKDDLIGIVTKKDILTPVSLEGVPKIYPIIQFSSKLDREYIDDLRELVEQFVERHKERLQNAVFSIYIREFKPEIKNLRLYTLRCHMDSKFGHFSVNSESWGVHNAMKQALILLEHQIHKKISKSRDLSRLYKNDFWRYVDIESLT